MSHSHFKTLFLTGFVPVLRKLIVAGDKHRLSDTTFCSWPLTSTGPREPPSNPTVFHWLSHSPTKTKDCFITFFSHLWVSNIFHGLLMTCFPFLWENRSNEQYHNLPYPLVHWHLYTHTPSPLRLLWNYHYPEAKSPLVSQILPLLPTGGRCSNNIPLSLLHYHLFHCHWIIPFSFKTCFSICPLEKYNPCLIPLLSYPISLPLCMAKLLKKVVCTWSLLPFFSSCL